MVIALLGLMAVGEGAAIAVTWPAYASIDLAVAQNRALEERLLDLDQKASEVDEVLTRLRQTESRLKNLGRARGDHGGPDLALPEETMANAGLGDGPLDPIAGAEGPDVGLDELMGEGPVDPSRLTPATAWALDLSRRMSEQLDMYRKGSVDLDALVAELDSVSTVRDALPGLWPTEGEITSGFGWRSDPVHGSVRFHAGLDIANKRGTPIYAVAPGRVIRAETSSSYGRMIDIDHGLGIVTRYAHCTTLRVKEGDVVERGDFISTMGSTGKSTGPHLHFELRVDDSAHDPLKYLPR